MQQTIDSPEVSLLFDAVGFDALSSSASLLRDEVDPHTLCQTVFAKLRKSHDIDIYFHYKVTSDGKGLELASCAGSPMVLDAIETTIAFGEAISGVVAEQQRSLYLSSSEHQNDPRTQYIQSVGGRCCVCYPLVSNGELLGTLSLGSTTRDSLDPNEMGLYELIACHLTLANTQQRRNAEIQKLEKLAHAGRMSATLAHEVSNPLHSLSQYLEALRDHLDTPQGTQLLDKATRQVNELAAITQTTLQMFRSQPVKRTRFDLSALVQSLAQDTKLPDDARLALAIEPGLWVNANPGELRQVILNLLLNAAQFNPAGLEIRLELRRNRKSVELRVIDQGPGISAAVRPRIFQPFFSTRAAGTGIGLWASREMVRRIGGDLYFSSFPELRPGTTFVVSLPLSV